MQLLKDLISVHAPSGEEFRMKDFLLDYIRKESEKWKVQPEILSGEELQDCIVLVFGKPRTAIFAHMDSVGFTVRYENQLVPIGGPEAENGMVLVGEDSVGPIQCKLNTEAGGKLFHDFPRAIDRGTTLVFKPELNVNRTELKGTFLDNRLGMYNALKVAESLEDGMVVFSAYEEHGGGSVPVILNYVYPKYPIKQALISDITWVTDGVHPGKGVVVSMRDHTIPRRVFLEKIINLANESGVPYQLEVEGSGSSDGREVHHSPYPIDWCFIGAPEDHVHSPEETVQIFDFQAMNDLYIYLMKNL